MKEIVLCEIKAYPSSNLVEMKVCYACVRYW